MVDFSAFPPEALAYFEAAQGRVSWESVFTPQALVRDVDRDIRGREAIAAWARAEVDGGVYQILSYSPEVKPEWRSVPLPVRQGFQGPGGESLRPPQKVVPRVGGLRLEWSDPVPLVREFRVQGPSWEEVR